MPGSHGSRARRSERKEAPERSRTRYLWLRNTISLSRAQQQLLDSLLLQRAHLRTVTAYQMKLAFQNFWALPAQEAFGFYLMHGKPPNVQPT